MSTSFEITSLSSKGQVVIPQSIREQLDLKEGEKFQVFAKDNYVMLRKLDRPSPEEWEELRAAMKKFAKENRITP